MDPRAGGAVNVVILLLICIILPSSDRRADNSLSTSDASVYARKDTEIRSETIAEGFTIFLLGLFKKVCLADSLSPYVGRVFDAAAAGHSISFFPAWQAALGYTLQIYFDFSDIRIWL